MKKVEKIKSKGEIEKEVKELVNRLGGMEKFIDNGDRVLIKPACNSWDPYPATTSPKVIEAVIDLVKERTDEITIGDSSGVLWKPTWKVFEDLGIDKLAKKKNIDLVDFDQGQFIEKTNEKAKYLKKVRLADIDKYDKMIFLPTLRSHRGARFTMSLKLGMGFPKLYDRWKMHEEHLEEKLADLNLYFKPDLIILDGRECFISGGPDKGEKRKSGVMLGSTNRVAIDQEGLKVLKQYKSVDSKLKKPIDQLPLIKHAKELGIDK